MGGEMCDESEWTDERTAGGRTVDGRWMDGGRTVDGWWTDGWTVDGRIGNSTTAGPIAFKFGVCLETS